VFTGLVDDVGTIERVAVTPAGREFRLSCSYDIVRDGESIAVNGVCLTVREHGPHWFVAAAMSATIGRTTMGNWTAGRRVNLERSLRVGDALGGHIVQGHVDGVGEVRAVRDTDDTRLIDLALPASVTDFVVPRGSIAVDGVSLTIAALGSELSAFGEPEGQQPRAQRREPRAEGREPIVRISLIEYTVRHTTLGDLEVGDEVHVEGDIIGKYVQRLLGSYGYAAATRSDAPATG
jgi:riboflavin synthase